MASKENPTLDGEVKELSDKFVENGESLGAETKELMTKSSHVEDEEEIEVDKEGEEEEEDKDEEEADDQEHKFAVGDFVWGKIKSHPWWPGQIYDPSNASKNAAKYQRRDRLLVAYFGDGTFAWCYPSQLKPFQENFDRMVKQSSSKSFLKAVEGAVDEIGRRVELEMTCSCVEAEASTRLIRPLAVNAGINEGVVVPDGGIGDLSITQYEPAKFLSCLRYIAQVVSETSMLELIVFRSQLSAFYRAKGYSQLPVYREPLGITDPQENVGNETAGGDHFEVQTTDLTASPAEEDWLSSPVGPWLSKTGLTSSQKWPGISEDKLYQRKKQRSMAELLAKDTDVKPDAKCETDLVGEGTVSGKPKSASRKKKKNMDSKVENGNVLAEEYSGSSRRTTSYKPKKSKLLGPTSATAENKAASVENNAGATEEGSKLGSVLRERKKSKYLSPPYTNLRRGHASSISAKDSETESLNAPKISHLGECVSMATPQFTGSPPIVKCSAEAFQKKMSNEPLVERKTFGGLSPRTPKGNQDKVVLDEGHISADKMLLDCRSAALDPLCLKEKKTSTTFEGFFSRFRSSLYHDGSDFRMYNKYLAGRARRKRNSIDVKPVSPGNDIHGKDQPISKGKSERKKRKSKEDAMLQSPKKKSVPADGKSVVKTNGSWQTKVEGSAAALLLTFAPGITLPSKDDLITIFGKFGDLNESETEILKDSGCARVVYERSSDAEEAYKRSEKISPLGPAVISYRVRYLSPARASEVDGNSLRQRLSPRLPKKRGNSLGAASTPPYGEVSSLPSVRQDLEMTMSMLGKSWNKLLPEVKSNIEDQVKSLLKKVTTMAESSFS